MKGLRDYAFAVAAVAAAVVVRFALDPALGAQRAFPTFSIASAVVAWYGGLGPAVLALVLGYLAGDLLFVTPRGTLGILHPEFDRLVGAVAYLVVSGTFVFLVESLRRSEARLEKLEREATRREEARARVSAIVESSNDAIVGNTLDGTVTSWNEGAERIFGYTAAEMIGRPISQIMPRDCSDDLRIILDAINRGERVNHYETERICKDGRRIQVSLSVSPIRDASGRVTGVAKIARVVSDRRRAEERLRASEDESRRLFDFSQSVMSSMGEGLYTVDTDGRVSFINPAAEQLFGWSSRELTGRKMHDLTHYAHPDGTPFPAEECAGLSVLQTGTPLIDHEDVFIRRDGTFFPVVYSASRIALGGNTAGLVVVFRDLTSQKQSEAEREELLAIAERARAEAERRRAEAEQASRAKDAFLATMSHELRTPLSPILAWSHLLRQGTLDAEKTARGIETIGRCAKAQAQIIDDLLDVSRIVAGRLRLDVRPVDVAPVVQAAVDVVRPAADAKGTRLQVVIDPRAAQVSGDPERLQQVVWNLLSNAVKFTPCGGRVQVVVKRVNSQVEIAVSDTGEGISPEFLPHVFERFQQAELGTSRAHGGLGLGLAIARHIVELHGGMIHAESPGVGKGAVFAVKLPLIVRARRPGEDERLHPSGGIVEPAMEEARIPLLGLRVLLVDDDPESNEVVRTLLASCGAEVEVAGSTAQALGVLERWKAHILVSDIGMPREDGFALIRKVRARDGSPGRLPAVALTAYTSVEDRVRLFSAGFQAHVTKPLDPAELVAVVASIARNTDKLA